MEEPLSYGFFVVPKITLLGTVPVLLQMPGDQAELGTGALVTFFRLVSTNQFLTCCPWGGQGHLRCGCAGPRKADNYIKCK